MVTLSQMSSRIWPRVAKANKNTKTNVHELELLDLEVIRWQDDLPDSLKYNRTEQDNLHSINSRLRILLYLRANQTRILIGRQVLLSTQTIMEHLHYASRVVDIARDTIQVLTYLNQTTETYRKQQGLYNYFLISALAALFLAVAHAPGQYAGTCRDEFYLALELVRGLSSNSFIGRRLWKTIRVLKEIGPKIGLAVRQDPHSDAAVAMAGLAGHPMDNMNMYQPPTDPALQGGWEGWNVMADDLGGLFEAAGNMPAYPPQGETDVNGEGELMRRFFGSQDGLSFAFKDLF
jgi:hypothetical protein